MPLQVLVAENNPATMRTTVNALADEFEVIKASNLDEARDVVKSNPVLAAIVMDGRLNKDRDQKDRSGWDLAAEVKSTGVARAPIIMYSQFAAVSEDSAPATDQKSGTQDPQITYVKKSVQDAELVKKILEAIHLHIKRMRNLEDIPRYHQPPLLAYAPNNGIEPIADELKKRGQPTEIIERLDQLKTAINLHPSAMIAIDVSNQAGIEAIDVVQTQRSNSDQNFYIAALTPGNEISPDLLHPGVNAVVTKDSPQTVASEIMVCKGEFLIELARKQLAFKRYRELVTQLNEARNSDSHDVTKALQIIQRALDWPYLMTYEKMILTALYCRLLAVPKAPMDPKTFDLCIEGASMLAKDRASSGDVRDWSERAGQHSPHFSMTLFDDDAFSGDAEETDD